MSGLSSVVLVILAELVGGLLTLLPGLVVVTVHHHVVVVVVSEKVIPHVGIVVEAIVEHEKGVGAVLLDKIPDSPVEVFKGIDI